jgi:hypothetical protein
VENVCSEDMMKGRTDVDDSGLDWMSAVGRAAEYGHWKLSSR